MIVVRGLKEVQKQLINLGSVTGTKAMRGAMRAATKPLLAKAKAMAPVRSGALREALAQTFTARSQSGFFGFGSGTRFSILVGPRIKSRTAVALYNLVYKPRTPIKGIFYGHFLEFGTATGTERTNFLHNSLLSTFPQCVNLLAVELKKRIEKALKLKRPVDA